MKRISQLQRFGKLLTVVSTIYFGLPTLVNAQHNAGDNGKILMIASNPSVSQQTGWPIGVWYSELTHPYWVFSESGYKVDIASLEGGEILFDGFSDPEDASGYAKFDYISRGFKKDPDLMAMTKNTLKLSEVDPNDYKAIFVCGGQGPMYTMYKNPEIEKFFADFYETGKPSAAICHGTNILLNTKLSNGDYLVKGKTWTGFASAEEQYADSYVGQRIQPFWIEEEARKMESTNFVVSTPFDAFGVRDGNLITGQQQNSGARAAELVLEALEEDRDRYPTYVMVHGAWADESAWGFVRDQLAIRANVKVVNLPAHGSDVSKPAAEVSLNDYTETVKNAIKEFDGKVTLIGHSMAGMIISQVAEEMPNKIDELIYVSAYLPKTGQSLLDLANTDEGSLVGKSLVFNEDQSAATIKKDILSEAVCSDCPDYMKEVLVKYHREEPTAPLGTPVNLSKENFGRVDKYYIHTTRDKAVTYDLQQRMIKDASFKKVHTINSSHLSFVTQPQKFIEIIEQITLD